MKLLYIECAMGAAGDMLAAALYELIDDQAAFLKRVNALLPDVVVSAEPSVKCGITGTHYRVAVNGVEEESVDVDPRKETSGRVRVQRSHPAHGHTGLRDIESIISRLELSERVKKDVLGVYRLIAEAEADAHGHEISEVHFHEVGTMDAIADIASVCLLMEALSPDRVVVSPVHVGSGMVRCAHGLLPVPAPATAYILRGAPIYGGMIRGELCTPTGAALLKYFADDFSGMPVLSGARIGYGMGKKDFEAANCVRAFWGESGSAGGPNGQIAELSCNLDDMTGEQMGFAMEALMEEGALDVFFTPITMKKSRPGCLLTLLCQPADADRFAALILKHTTTFGVRRQLFDRYTLAREIAPGEVRVKTGEGYGVRKSKREYEDLARRAKMQGKSIFEV